MEYSSKFSLFGLWYFYLCFQPVGALRCNELLFYSYCPSCISASVISFLKNNAILAKQTSCYDVWKHIHLIHLSI